MQSPGSRRTENLATETQSAPSSRFPLSALCASVASPLICLVKSRCGGPRRRVWLCRSPAASEPRSDKEPRALRRAPLRGFQIPHPDSRFQSAIRNPQSAIANPQSPCRASVIPAGGFFGLVQGLLRRPPSAARTTEQGPISGPGLLPCVVQSKFVKGQGPRDPRDTSDHRVAERQRSSLCYYLWKCCCPEHISGSFRVQVCTPYHPSFPGFLNSL